MRRLFQVAVVALVAVFIASAQDAVNLLKRTAQNYHNLRSFEVIGHLSAVIPGTRLVLHVQAINAAAGPSFVPAKTAKDETPNLQEILSFRESTITDEQGRQPKTPLDEPITMPSRW